MATTSVVPLDMHALQDSQDVVSGNGGFMYVVNVFESLL